MNLEDYGNQSEKLPQWSVVLEKDDIELTMCDEYHGFVKVNWYSWEYTVLSDYKGYMFTTDSDGNKKYPCVFMLNFNPFE